MEIVYIDKRDARALFDISSMLEESMLGDDAPSIEAATIAINDVLAMSDMSPLISSEYENEVPVTYYKHRFNAVDRAIGRMEIRTKIEGRAQDEDLIISAMQDAIDLFEDRFEFVVAEAIESQGKKEEMCEEKKKEMEKKREKAASDPCSEI